MLPILKLINKKEKLVIGLMSGTSMDGIDAALVKILNSGNDTKIELLNFQTFPYSDQLRKELLKISQPGQGTVKEICCMNFVIAEFYTDAIFEICELSNLDISQIDLIGSHGQTIHHLPDAEEIFGKKILSTLQIGEPSLIANRTGVTTVANFRSTDLALGGLGAPLIPFFDFLLFNSNKYNRVLLNIGGIANITVLPKSMEKDRIAAFDTGPGNMVVDALMKKLFNRNYDENGSVALKGNVSEILLDKLLRHSYFSKSAPKSTGREEFGNLFVDQILKLSKQLNISSEDIIATVTELTAITVKDGLKFSPLSINQVDQLIVSGGGIFNKALMKSLKTNFNNSEVLTSDHFGIPGDAKEAICFAVLANETIAGNPTNLPSVTGAARPAILGTISFV